MKRLKDATSLILVLALLGATVNMVVIVVSVYLGGLYPAAVIREFWPQWWVGNINGVLVMTPLLLVWLNRRFSGSASFWVEILALAAGLVLICAAIFGPWWLGGEAKAKFLIFPLIILAAYRFGQRGTTLLLFTTVLATMWWLSHNPAAFEAAHENLPVLQIFIMTLAATGLIMGAAITERKEAENNLLRVTRELKRSNQELDDFAYIVSHDLKEPLRGLQNFSQFLLEDYEDKLDTEGKNKLHTISDLTKRLEALLDTLLYYSRLGRTELAVRATDLNDVVRNVIDMLSITLKEKNTTVDILRKLPVISCDSAHIGEVFQNLIGNALKYNDKPENKIEIGFMTDHLRAPGEVVFFVRDHGIGIQEENLETIFKIFKRLHARDAYGGGTGSGLAIVRKILLQHGGNVWAESKGKNQGTTLFFTIPEKKE
ncbi:MAG: MASE1 domain-containing protein [Proteobacteria bacterium]|nr:MASE1 domain-containing protein [Pseudomonadota bacterium]